MAPVSRWAKACVAAFVFAAVAGAASWSGFRLIGVGVGVVAAGACVVLLSVATILALAALLRIGLARGRVRGIALPVVVLGLVALSGGGAWAGIRHALKHGLDYRSPDGGFALRTGPASREAHAPAAVAPLTTETSRLESPRGSSRTLLEIPKVAMEPLDPGKAVLPVQGQLVPPDAGDDAYPFGSGDVTVELSIPIQGVCSGKTNPRGTWQAVKQLTRFDFKDPSIEVVSAAFTRAVTEDDRTAIVAIIVEVGKVECAEPLLRELVAELDRLHPKESHVVVRQGSAVGFAQRLQDSVEVRESFDRVVVALRRKVGGSAR